MALKPIIRLWIIRHGQTSWNKNGRCLGRTDIPLTQVGRQSVKTLAKHIDIAQCDAIYSSPARRALQTTKLVMGNIYRKSYMCSELREIDFGNWEGLKWKTIIEMHHDEWAAWEQDPVHSAPYNGESLEVVKDRVSIFYERLILNHEGKTILLIGHGGSLNILLCYLFHFPLKEIWTFRLSPASLSEVLIYPDGPVLTILNYAPWYKSEVKPIFIYDNETFYHLATRQSETLLEASTTCIPEFV